MTYDENKKIPSNGSLIVDPNGRVQFSGSPNPDINQVVTYNKLLQTFESTSLGDLPFGTGDGGEVTISPTPPEDAQPGDLWWNSTLGRLFIYYSDEDGDVWVDASPNGGGTGSSVTLSPSPPENAVPGDLWWNTIEGRLYIYYSDPDGNVWVDTSPNGGGGGGGGNVTISDTPPSSPAPGDLWWNTIDGRLFIYYNDGNTAQWVDASPNGGSGGGAATVVVSETPPSTNIQGTLWWNSIDGRLFIYYDDGNTAQWVDASPNGGAGGGDGFLVQISPTPPDGVEGQLWWNSDEGRLYIYYNDGTTAQWVDTSPNGGGTDVAALQQQITDLEARVAALEGN